MINPGRIRTLRRIKRILVEDEIIKIREQHVAMRKPQSPMWENFLVSHYDIYDTNYSLIKSSQMHHNNQSNEAVKTISGLHYIVISLTIEVKSECYHDDRNSSEELEKWLLAKIR